MITKGQVWFDIKVKQPDQDTPSPILVRLDQSFAYGLKYPFKDKDFKKWWDMEYVLYWTVINDPVDN